MAQPITPKKLMPSDINNGYLYEEGNDIVTHDDMNDCIQGVLYSQQKSEAVVIDGDGNKFLKNDGTYQKIQPIDLPIASPTQTGGIKVGNNLTITEDGTLSATGGGGGESGNSLRYYGLESTSTSTMLFYADAFIPEITASDIKAGDTCITKNGYLYRFETAGNLTGIFTNILTGKSNRFYNAVLTANSATFNASTFYPPILSANYIQAGDSAVTKNGRLYTFTNNANLTGTLMVNETGNSLRYYSANQTSQTTVSFTASNFNPSIVAADIKAGDTCITLNGYLYVFNTTGNLTGTFVRDLNGSGSGGGTKVTVGGVEQDTWNADTKQDKLTAGNNITIDSNNVISASSGGGDSDTLAYKETSVSSTTRTVSIPNITSYNDMLNKIFWIQASAGGSTSVPTLNVNGLGAKPIYFPSATSNATSSIPSSALWIRNLCVYGVKYDTERVSGGSFIIVNPQIRKADIGIDGTVTLSSSLNSDTDSTVPTSSVTTKLNSRLTGVESIIENNDFLRTDVQQILNDTQKTQALSNLGITNVSLSIAFTSRHNIVANISSIENTAGVLVTFINPNAKVNYTINIPINEYIMTYAREFVYKYIDFQDGSEQTVTIFLDNVSDTSISIDIEDSSNLEVFANVTTIATNNKIQ